MYCTRYRVSLSNLNRLVWNLTQCHVWILCGRDGHLGPMFYSIYNFNAEIPIWCDLCLHKFIAPSTLLRFTSNSVGLIFIALSKIVRIRGFTFSQGYFSTFSRGDFERSISVLKILTDFRCTCSPSLVTPTITLFFCPMRNVKYGLI